MPLRQQSTATTRPRLALCWWFTHWMDWRKAQEPFGQPMTKNVIMTLLGYEHSVVIREALTWRFSKGELA